MGKKQLYGHSISPAKSIVMIKFADIHPDIVPVLEANGITESDLFNNRSDLHIGCRSFNQARAIATGGQWRAMASTFRPAKGSDMEQYLIVVDITLGYIAYFTN